MMYNKSLDEGGQMQLVCIAYSIVTEPKFIVFDETMLLWCFEGKFVSCC